MRIRLIEPEPPGMNVSSKLGLPAMGAALTSQGHDVSIYVPQFSAAGCAQQSIHGSAQTMAQAAHVAHGQWHGHGEHWSFGQTGPG